MLSALLLLLLNAALLLLVASRAWAPLRVTVNVPFWAALVLFATAESIYCVFRTEALTPGAAVQLSTIAILSAAALVLVFVFLGAVAKLRGRPRISLGLTAASAATIAAMFYGDWLSKSYGRKPIGWVLSVFLGGNQPLDDLVHYVSRAFFMRALAVVILIVLLTPVAWAAHRFSVRVLRGQVVLNPLWGLAAPLVIMLDLLFVLEAGFLLSPRTSAYFDAGRIFVYPFHFFEHASAHQLALQRGRPVEPADPRRIEDAIGAFSAGRERRPDIFLFVVESLRQDVVSREDTPFLFELRGDSRPHEISVTNANATAVAWYSLFESRYPLAWAEERSVWTSGSPGLRILRRLGYRVAFYFSTYGMGAFGLDRLVMGDGRVLVDQITKAKGDSFWQRDLEVLAGLDASTHSDTGGRPTIHVAFLDSTHSDYYYPPSQLESHRPTGIPNFFFPKLWGRIEIPYKNRYLNAVSFVDSLLAKSVAAIRSDPRTRDAIVVILGDHGQEFYEHGSFFHGTQLTAEQTEAPILIQFPDSSRAERLPVLSLVDVFPLILHRLGASGDYGTVFAQSELGRSSRPPYTVVALFDAARDPTVFSIVTEKYKLFVELSDEAGPSVAPLLIRKLTDRDGREGPRLDSEREWRDFLKQNFGAPLCAIFAADL